MTFAPTCFGSHRNHPQGAAQYLAKNYKYGSAVLVGMDVVIVMAACEPVHITHKHTGSHAAITLICTHRTQARRFTCCHNNDYVHADKHSRTIFVVFSQVLGSSLRMVPV
jgi:hypothetical protein